MTAGSAGMRAGQVPPPSKHQLALMIWVAVLPTLTATNLLLADWLQPMSTVLRTFVLATIAVPIVIYGLMPRLHRIRGRLLARGGEAVVASSGALGAEQSPGRGR
jgi:antibiotic biosynthesis monooxygenase (ABM) superfamily enzyme